jgi:hypothetical protein
MEQGREREDRSKRKDTKALVLDLQQKYIIYQTKKGLCP